jgi:ABC-type spermidine/putrescine transport system permease subunit II
MQEEVKVADQHKKLGLPPGMDPRNLDPRRMLDSAAAERVLKAQALARAQAQAASTVVIGTIVTLISSAFGFVAALAWNDAIKNLLTAFLQQTLKLKNIDATTQSVIQAVTFTIIAVIAIVILQRVAGRWAKKAAIGAAAGEGSY